jgi:hypothetical protein
MLVTPAKKSNIHHHNPMITSEMLVSLINLSGRQRMLSQRVALNVALAASGITECLAEAKDALTLFRHSHTILVHGNQEYPGIFFNDLEKVYFGTDKSESKITTFIALAEQAIVACEGAHQSIGSAVSELGLAANAIVVILNKITITYEAESRRRASERHKQHQALMSSIQKIAKEAKIVSFNAQVIAARAGEAGKEFAVVAGVMTDITEKIDHLAIAALNNE